MESRQAAAQIEFIWAQVARTECFRGYRPATVAVTGILGLGAACLQPFVVPAPEKDLQGYIGLWMAIAVSSLSITLFEVVLSYFRTESPLQRRLTRRALQQFLPSLLVGGIITQIISEQEPTRSELLPGLWAICFGLGVFSSVPFVTPAVIWAGVYYFVAGLIVLWIGDGPSVFSPWTMGATFGVGQILMAGLLYFAEIKRHGEA